MAEFCFDCIRKYEPGTPVAQNGLRHGRRGELVFDVCEGCGPGWFDWEGKKRRDDDKEEQHDDRPR